MLRGLVRGLASRSLPALPARVLDDGVRPRKYQGGVIVLESDEIGGLAACSAYLDDLACSLRLTHDIAVNVKPVSDYCMHALPPDPRSVTTCPRRHTKAPAWIYPDWRVAESTLMSLTTAIDIYGRKRVLRGTQ